MDTGLHSLVALARFNQIPAEPEQLLHQFAEPGRPLSDTQLLLAAKALGLKAKCISPSLSSLTNNMLPAIAKTCDGNYIVLARTEEQSKGGRQTSSKSFLVHDLRESAPRPISREDFDALWSGDLILLARRPGLGESLKQKFDIYWFIPSLVKYKKLFAEVVIASFSPALRSCYPVVLPSGDGQSASAPGIYYAGRSSYRLFCDSCF